MLYIIGGAPRTGKSTLASRLLADVDVHAQTLSTDALRDAIRKTHTPESAPELFLWRKTNQISEQDWIREYTDNPFAMARILLKESSYLRPSIERYIRTISEETGDDLIIEGAALLPDLLQRIDTPFKAIFLVDTSLQQIDRLYDLSRDNDKDWMWALGYSKDKIKAWTHFNIAFSKLVARQCNANNFQYFDVGALGFDEALSEAKRSLH